MNTPLDPEDRYSEAVRRAEMKLVEQVSLQYFRQKLRGGETPRPIFSNPGFKEMYAFINNRTSDTHKACLITVTMPDEESDPVLVASIAYKIAGYRNLLTNPEMSLEQRSDDPESPFGYHSHIVAYVEKPKSDILKRCNAAYKQVMKVSPPNNAIDIKYMPYDDGLKYITKEKHCDKDLGLGYIGKIENLKDYLDNN